MQNLVRPYTKAVLLEQLKAACNIKGIDFPGRICHRNKSALVCFICDNFPDFPRGFPTLSQMSHPNKRLHPESTDEPSLTPAAEPTDIRPPVPPLIDEVSARPRRLTWEWSTESNPFNFNFWADMPDDE
jgi:hypothetical protein